MKYKLDNNRKSIAICYCRLYEKYKHSNEDVHIYIVDRINKNKNVIGSDIINREVREKLSIAIWESVCNSKKYPYEIWDLPTISRNEFYERKRKFLENIAFDLGL